MGGGPEILNRKIPFRITDDAVKQNETAYDVYFDIIINFLNTFLTLFHSLSIIFTFYYCKL